MWQEDSAVCPLLQHQSVAGNKELIRFLKANEGATSLLNIYLYKFTNGSGRQSGDIRLTRWTAGPFDRGTDSGCESGPQTQHIRGGFTARVDCHDCVCATNKSILIVARLGGSSRKQGYQLQIKWCTLCVFFP